MKTTLFMVEHDMSIILALPIDLVFVYGQIVATDTPDRIRNNKAG